MASHIHGNQERCCSRKRGLQLENPSKSTKGQTGELLVVELFDLYGITTYEQIAVIFKVSRRRKT
jgi:hypothetical protein